MFKQFLSLSILIIFFNGCSFKLSYSLASKESIKFAEELCQNNNGMRGIKIHFKRNYTYEEIVTCKDTTRYSMKTGIME